MRKRKPLPRPHGPARASARADYVAEQCRTLRHYREAARAARDKAQAARDALAASEHERDRAVESARASRAFELAAREDLRQMQAEMDAERAELTAFLDGPEWQRDLLELMGDLLQETFREHAALRQVCTSCGGLSSRDMLGMARKAARDVERLYGLAPLERGGDAPSVGRASPLAGSPMKKRG